MDYLYFDDFTLGQSRISASFLISEADIIDFAVKFDPQPMHTDPSAAKSITGGLIASGWHTASIAMRLLITSHPRPSAPGTLGLGVENLKWLKPVRPGDQLHLHVTVIGLHPSASRPDHGVVTSRLVTFNQQNEPVQELTTSAIFPKRKIEETQI